MTLHWNDFDKTDTYNNLLHSYKTSNILEPLTAKKIHSSKISVGGGLDYYYGASMLSQELINQLQNLADEQQLTEKYAALLSGEKFNTGEDRRVLHHLTREKKQVTADREALAYFYQSQNRRIREFVQSVFSGKISGSTGKQFDTVVQIGIGGSDLGPRALYLALKGAYPVKLKAHFVSNIDPDDAAEILSLINPETTLFILVSKSGTTQETLSNRDFFLAKMNERNIPAYNPAQHLIAVTSKTSPLAQSSSVLESFYIDDSIGGRYSSTSAVGGLVLSLTFGPDIFDQILAGAAEVDAKSHEKDIRKNAPLMDAMIGVFNRNIREIQSTVILPYSQALSRFPAHLQQLDMESNGKSVNRNGKEITYKTGPIVFGEPGTNGQHSFYQLLHQGSDIASLQFIGFHQSQRGEDLFSNGSSNQIKLNANLAAQIVAFAKGRFHENANKNFKGMRPSTLLLADKLSAHTLGALLAHYENKIMFQGFCWNLNSFDQEGVQLGKILTQSILDSSSDDEELKAYADILKI